MYSLPSVFVLRPLARHRSNTGSGHVFGMGLLPYMCSGGEAIAHPFALSCVSRCGDAESYWRDVGTLDAYWAANIDLVAVTPELDMYADSWPIITHQEQLPPADRKSVG